MSSANNTEPSNSLPMEESRSFGRSSGAPLGRRKQLDNWKNSDISREPLETTAKGRTPKIRFSDSVVFHAAIQSHDVDEVQKMIDSGININIQNNDGMTGLHQAVIEEDLDMIDLLLENGCDTNVQDMEGWTPLHAAAGCGYIEVCEKLLEFGANPGITNNEGKTTLELAEDEMLQAMIQKEIEKQGISLDEYKDEERKLLMEEALALKDNPSLSYSISKQKACPLHIAASKGYLDVIEVLLAARKEMIHVMDEDDWTPLHAAVYWEQYEAAQLLVEHGSDVNAKTKTGEGLKELSDEAPEQYQQLINISDEFKKGRHHHHSHRPSVSSDCRPSPSSVKRRMSREMCKETLKQDMKNERKTLDNVPNITEEGQTEDTTNTGTVRVSSKEDWEPIMKQSSVENSKDVEMEKEEQTNENVSTVVSNKPLAEEEENKITEKRNETSPSPETSSSSSSVANGNKEAEMKTEQLNSVVSAEHNKTSFKNQEIKNMAVTTSPVFRHRGSPVLTKRKTSGTGSVINMIKQLENKIESEGTSSVPRPKVEWVGNGSPPQIRKGSLLTNRTGPQPLTRPIMPQPSTVRNEGSAKPSTVTAVPSETKLERRESARSILSSTLDNLIKGNGSTSQKSSNSSGSGMHEKSPPIGAAEEELSPKAGRTPSYSKQISKEASPGSDSVFPESPIIEKKPLEQPKTSTPITSTSAGLNAAAVPKATTPTSATATPSSATATPSSATATPSSATATPSSANATPSSATATPSSATATPSSATATPISAAATDSSDISTSETLSTPTPSLNREDSTTSIMSTESILSRSSVSSRRESETTRMRKARRERKERKPTQGITQEDFKIIMEGTQEDDVSKSEDSATDSPQFPRKDTQLETSNSQTVEDAESSSMFETPENSTILVTDYSSKEGAPKMSAFVPAPRPQPSSALKTPETKSEGILWSTPEMQRRIELKTAAEPTAVAEASTEKDREQEEVPKQEVSKQEVPKQEVQKAEVVIKQEEEVVLEWDITSSQDGKENLAHNADNDQTSTDFLSPHDRGRATSVARRRKKKERRSTGIKFEEDGEVSDEDLPEELKDIMKKEKAKKEQQATNVDATSTEVRKPDGENITKEVAIKTVDPTESQKEISSSVSASPNLKKKDISSLKKEDISSPKKEDISSLKKEDKGRVIVTSKSMAVKQTSEKPASPVSQKRGATKVIISKRNSETVKPEAVSMLSSQKQDAPKSPISQHKTQTATKSISKSSSPDKKASKSSRESPIVKRSEKIASSATKSDRSKGIEKTTSVTKTQPQKSKVRQLPSAPSEATSDNSLLSDEVKVLQARIEELEKALGAERREKMQFKEQYEKLLAKQKEVAIESPDGLTPAAIEDMQKESKRLKDENNALIRVIAKMSRAPSLS